MADVFVFCWLRRTAGRLDLPTLNELVVCRGVFRCSLSQTQRDRRELMTILVEDRLAYHIDHFLAMSVTLRIILRGGVLVLPPFRHFAECEIEATRRALNDANWIARRCTNAEPVSMQALTVVIDR